MLPSHPGQGLPSALSLACRSVEIRPLPSKEERDVKCGAVQIDKLKKKHFQGEAVLPLRLCARLLCGQKGSRVWEVAFDPFLTPSALLPIHTGQEQRCPKEAAGDPSLPTDGVWWNGPPMRSSSLQTSPNQDAVGSSYWGSWGNGCPLWASWGTLAWSRDS